MRIRLKILRGKLKTGEREREFCLDLMTLEDLIRKYCESLFRWCLYIVGGESFFLNLIKFFYHQGRAVIHYSKIFTASELPLDQGKVDLSS